jgi:hypothetical protein
MFSYDTYSLLDIILVDYWNALVDYGLIYFENGLHSER